MIDIQAPRVIKDLTKEELSFLQEKLSILGYYPSNMIDGIYGPNTQNAWERFKKDEHQSEPNLIGKGSLDLLIQKSANPPKLLIITEFQAENIFKNQITPIQLQGLNNCLQKFEITTISRLRHFMAQIGHESGGLKWMSELADGSAYEGRKDLGNIHSGDGRKYKGVDALQMTGRHNYQLFANYIKDPRVMEGWRYVKTNYPFLPSGFWWVNNKMNQLCDKSPSVEQVTKKVNGGYNGLNDRKAYYARACQFIK